MKVAVLGESAADEGAIHILSAGILGRPTEPVAGPALRTRGWPSVASILPVVIKHLYYQTDAEGLIVVVDSNSSPVHEPGHEERSGADPLCRWCHLQQIVTETTVRLRSVPGRLPLKTAIGLAVPVIEAWYLSGIDPHVTEATWAQSARRGSMPYNKVSLKQTVYGTDRPPLDLERRRAVEEATRVARDLATLETTFPNGFGRLARSLRAW
jgi:hypothetical protein